MSTPIDLAKLTPCDSMAGEDDEETVDLRKMLDGAESYMRAFRWCPPIVEEYLGFGVGGVLALFLFRFEKPIQGTDEWLWVVEGNLPSAYFVVDDATDTASALITYCQIMEDWTNAVLSGSSLTGCYPIAAEPSQENAKSLQGRIKFIRDTLIPMIQ